jgi:hypothetical protein
MVSTKLFFSFGRNATYACWNLAQFNTFGGSQAVARLTAAGCFSAVTTTTTICKSGALQKRVPFPKNLHIPCKFEGFSFLERLKVSKMGIALFIGSAIIF